MRKRELKVGDHVRHTPTGDYLGRVTKLRNATVVFDGGRRTRDGHAVTFATYREIERCEEPA